MKTEVKTGGLTEEQAAKARFVDDLNAALISNGEGRYQFLEDTPLSYVVDGYEEYVVCGNRRACVSGDSLTALMSDVSSQLF